MSAKFQTPESCLSSRLLRYVRDAAPTEKEFLTWIGGAMHASTYHTLRKARLLVLKEDRLQLAPEHVSADGKRFSFGCSVYHLDSDEVWQVRRNQKARLGDGL